MIFGMAIICVLSVLIFLLGFIILVEAIKNSNMENFVFSVSLLSIGITSTFWIFFEILNF